MRVSLRAWYFRSTIDLKKVREILAEYPARGQDPLILEVGEGRYLVVTNFGGLVLWPFDEALARAVASRIQETLEDPFLVEEVEDRLAVETGKGQARVLFNEVWLPEAPTLDQIRILSVTLAQSVALEYLEREVDTALQHFLPYLQQLRLEGRVRISTRRILKNIGFLGQTRHAVLANLTLFDKPDATWESEGLEQLYKALFDMFDLPERQDAIERKLQFLADSTNNLYDYISTRKSLRLEWVVVILIAAEIVGFVIYEMFN